jgi:hypothetical protein
MQRHQRRTGPDVYGKHHLRHLRRANGQAAEFPFQRARTSEWFRKYEESITKGVEIMRATVKMVNGEEFVITGDVATSIHGYFTQKVGANVSLPIVWVGDNACVINLNHAISVKFSKE